MLPQLLSQSTSTIVTTSSSTLPSQQEPLDGESGPSSIDQEVMAGTNNTKYQTQNNNNQLHYSDILQLNVEIDI